jgi:hypothetical protein
MDPVHRNDPVLGFRLDPGEPGMLRQARASDATLLVTAQERRNLGRLKSEAFREGRIPIKAGTVFTRSLPGTSVGTVVAGQTTVVSVPDSTPPVSGVRIPGDERVRSLLEDMLAGSPNDAAGQALISLEPESSANRPAAPTATDDTQDGPGPATDSEEQNSAARVGAQAFERDQLTFLRSRQEPQAAPAALDLIA